MKEASVITEGDITWIATLIANATPEQLTTKPVMYCSPKNYELIKTASKDSGIYFIEGIPHYNGYMFVPFNHWELE